MSRGDRAPVLDPATRLGEILFGLIMVLSFTGSLHAASAGREEIRTMLFGALGCNLAWGIVDAVMYLMNDLVVRTRAFSDLRRLQAAATDAEADAVLVSRLSSGFAGEVRPGDLDGIRERLRRLPPPPLRATVNRESAAGAGAVFLLVFCSTFPAAAPFLIFRDPALALRVSNAVAVSMMFVAGFLVGRYAGLSPMKTGFGVAGIGLALVAITMALGG